MDNICSNIYSAKFIYPKAYPESLRKRGCVFLGEVHYVYRITDIIENKHYYGVRTDEVGNSNNGIGIGYFSSSFNKEFIDGQKANPQNYKYKVVRIFDTRQDANSFEEYIHAKFNVATNDRFFNQHNASCNFTTVGMVAARCKKTNKIFFIGMHDTRLLTGELVHCNTGFCQAYSALTGELFPRVSVDDPRWESGEIVGASKGYCVCIEVSTGKNCLIKTNDPGIKSGVYRHINKGFTQARVKSTLEVLKRVSVDDPRWESGEIESIHVGRFLAISKDGTYYFISKDDPRFISKELVGLLKGKTVIYNSITNKREVVNLDDPRYLSGELKHINHGRITVKDKTTGHFKKVNCDDPDIVSGLYVPLAKGKMSARCIHTGEVKLLSTDSDLLVNGDFIPINQPLIIITDSVSYRRYMADGIDKIPEGWVIYKKFINKGVNLIDVFNINTGELYKNVFASPFSSNFDVSSSALLKCAAKNKRTTDEINSTKGFVVKFSEELTI